jgi:hypothetical protein
MTALARKLSQPPASFGAGGRVRLVTVNGVTQRLFDVARQHKLNPKNVISRLDRALAKGRTQEDALEYALTPSTKKHSSKERIAHRRATMLATIKPFVAVAPVTVRQIYYQMTVHHPDMIANTTNGYKMTAADMKVLREEGVVIDGEIEKLPYEDVIDNTRRCIRGYGIFDNVGDALKDVVDYYQQNIWLDMPCLVWVCIEKDALASTIEDICLDYQVPLLVARGYASLSFLHAQAKIIRNETRPVHVYLMGDYDPEGVDARRVTEAKLREFAPDVDFHFHSLAVNDEDQITKLGLKTFKVKKEGSRAKAWGKKPGAELDAIAPDVLRKMVTDAIHKHMSKRKRDQLIQDPEELDRVRELIEELA